LDLCLLLDDAISVWSPVEESGGSDSAKSLAPPTSDFKVLQMNGSSFPKSVKKKARFTLQCSNL
jgi:hypothetical protein